MGKRKSWPKTSIVTWGAMDFDYPRSFMDPPKPKSFIRGCKLRDALKGFKFGRRKKK